MNKVLIVSFQWTDNYGGVLQNFALNRIINSLGFDSYVLNYYNPKKISSKEDFKQKIKHKLWSFVKGPLGSQKRHKRTIAFKRKYISIQDLEFHSFNSLINKFEDFDYIIVGSDQVWNFNISNDPETYLLSFATNPKKISYAASFGVNSISNNLLPTIKKELNKFSYISVRDSFSSKIINNL